MSTLYWIAAGIILIIKTFVPEASHDIQLEIVFWSLLILSRLHKIQGSR